MYLVDLCFIADGNLRVLDVPDDSHEVWLNWNYYFLSAQVVSQVRKSTHTHLLLLHSSIVNNKMFANTKRYLSLSLSLFFWLFSFSVLLLSFPLLSFFLSFLQLVLTFVLIFIYITTASGSSEMFILVGKRQRAASRIVTFAQDRPQSVLHSFSVKRAKASGHYYYYCFCFFFFFFLEGWCRG